MHNDYIIRQNKTLKIIEKFNFERWYLDNNVLKIEIDCRLRNIKSSLLHKYNKHIFTYLFL